MTKYYVKDFEAFKKHYLTVAYTQSIRNHYIEMRNQYLTCSNSHKYTWKDKDFKRHIYAEFLDGNYYIPYTDIYITCGKYKGEKAYFLTFTRDTIAWDKTHVTVGNRYVLTDEAIKALNLKEYF